MRVSEIYRLFVLFTNTAIVDAEQRIETTYLDLVLLSILKLGLPKLSRLSI